MPEIVIQNMQPSYIPTILEPVRMAAHANEAWVTGKVGICK